MLLKKKKWARYSTWLNKYLKINLNYLVISVPSYENLYKVISTP